MSKDCDNDDDKDDDNNNSDDNDNDSDILEIPKFSPFLLVTLNFSDASLWDMST